MKQGDKVKHTRRNGIYTNTRYGEILKVNGALALVRIANFGSIDDLWIPCNELELE